MRNDSHGGDIYTQPVKMDFSVNLNPMGIPESVKKAAAMSLEHCSAYPDSRSGALIKALAEENRVPEEWIVCGNGAADLIFGLALALKPRRALIAAPTFAEYRQALNTVGCVTESFMLREEQDFSLTEEMVAAAIKERKKEKRKPDLVILCNPSNPTGQVVLRSQMEKIAGLCMEEGIWLAVDQCFDDFLEHPEAVSMVPALSDLPNVVILRAFTKIYAMAGLRLGYALCKDQKLVRELRLVRQPWSVSTVAQEAGLAALKEKEYRTRAGRQTAQARKWLACQLSRLGFKVYPSQVNFLLFRTSPRWAGERLKEELLGRGILIRSCGNFEGLDSSYYRICVGLQKDNEELIRVMEEILQNEGGE